MVSWQKKKQTKHEKYTPMGFELLTSLKTIQHVSHWGTCALLSRAWKCLSFVYVLQAQVYRSPYTSVLTKQNYIAVSDCSTEKTCTIPVIKTCRQASVTNSLVTLNFFNFTNIPTQPWMEKKIMRLFETECSLGPRLHSDHHHFVNGRCIITPFHNLFSKFSG